ncbi:MAG TPA: helix-turn-helix domain-containing protein [Roseiarcus sp.]|nr:helix-turn-helix domain-containing protein [Roseiarcus sp.]
MPETPPFSPKFDASNSPRVVEIVGFDGVQLLDVSGPIQVFASANEMLAKSGAPPRYAVRIVARAAPSLTSSSGIGLTSQELPRPDSFLDTLLVAGGPGVSAATQDEALVEWLTARAQTARRTASVCTGAYLLAAAGLLDGRRATTHWAHCEDFARRFPAVRVESDPIYLRDGPIWTSAGVTAGIDLALALLEEDLGRDVALAVARYLVMFLKRPGGQAQFSAALALQAGEAPFGKLHAWMEANLASELSLSALAAQAGMSERNFSRRYVEATGLTPARAVERLRVEAARRLLCESKTPTKRIARQCGLGTEETMRRSFQRLLACSPQDYRARFSA